VEEASVDPAGNKPAARRAVASSSELEHGLIGIMTFTTNKGCGRYIPAFVHFVTDNR
jgi:hypothetical protein